MTSLMLAAEGGQDGVLRMLLNCVPQKHHPYYINAQLQLDIDAILCNPHQKRVMPFSALAFAALGGHASAAKLLLREGASLGQLSEKSHQLVKRGAMEAVKETVAAAGEQKDAQEVRGTSRGRSWAPLVSYLTAAVARYAVKRHACGTTCRVAVHPLLHGMHNPKKRPVVTVLRFISAREAKSCNLRGVFTGERFGASGLAWRQASIEQMWRKTSAVVLELLSAAECPGREDVHLLSDTLLKLLLEVLVGRYPNFAGVSTSDFAARRRLFDLFDIDADGVLSKEEYASFLRATSLWGIGRYTSDAWDNTWLQECEGLGCDPATGVTRTCFALLYEKYRPEHVTSDLRAALQNADVPAISAPQLQLRQRLFGVLLAERGRRLWMRAR